MRLLHYSPKPFTLRPCSYLQTATYGAPGKPNGLWVSVEGEDGWANWCSAEMPAWIEGRAVTEIVLKSDANILRIENDAQLMVFHEKYGLVPLYEMRAYPRHLWSKQPSWARVAETYDGIIIAPYQWGRRLDSVVRWYYGWDCASGCIWDMSVIESCKEAGVAKAIRQER